MYSLSFKRLLTSIHLINEFIDFETMPQKRSVWRAFLWDNVLGAPFFSQCTARMTESIVHRSAQLCCSRKKRRKRHGRGNVQMVVEMMQGRRVKKWRNKAEAHKLFARIMETQRWIDKSILVGRARTLVCAHMQIKGHRWTLFSVRASWWDITIMNIALNSLLNSFNFPLTFIKFFLLFLYSAHRRLWWVCVIWQKTPLFRCMLIIFLLQPSILFIPNWSFPLNIAILIKVNRDSATKKTSRLAVMQRWKCWEIIMNCTKNWKRCLLAWESIHCTSLWIDVGNRIQRDWWSMQNFAETPQFVQLKW